MRQVKAMLNEGTVSGENHPCFFGITSEIGWKAALERSWKLLYCKLCIMLKLLFKGDYEFTKPNQDAPRGLAKSQSPKIHSLWSLKPTVQSHWYHVFKSDMNHLCHWAGSCLITVPFLFLEIISQILLREHGSTPVVGSSSITTLDPPRRAIAIDNFLFIPPDREPASLWRWLYSPVSFKVLENKEKTTPKGCPSSIF